jgi:hypothetical protein
VVNCQAALVSSHFALPSSLTLFRGPCLQRRGFSGNFAVDKVGGLDHPGLSRCGPGPTLG